MVDWPTQGHHHHPPPPRVPAPPPESTQWEEPGPRWAGPGRAHLKKGGGRKEAREEKKGKPEEGAGAVQ